MAGRALCVLGTTALLVACDDDPTPPSFEELEASLELVPDVLGRQDAVRVLFNQPIQARTALDPSNFVVVNQCTGLQVAGALRLGRDTTSARADRRDTLVFSPSQAVPFLTPLAVRVQNILTTRGGQALRRPLTFERSVEAPEVSDLSWELLPSPTSENLRGINFVDENTGWMISTGGTVFRTDNGGQVFSAIFKNVDISDAFNIRAATIDSVYFVAGLVTPGGGQQWALFESVNGGLGFTPIHTIGINLRALSLRRLPRTAPAVGQRTVLLYSAVRGTQSSVFRNAIPDTIVQATGVPANLDQGGSVLSPNGRNAVVAGGAFGSSTVGVAAYSTDGGRTFTGLNLPAGTPRLSGAVFRNDTSFFLLGDQSTVLRVSLSTGTPTFTSVTAGIPQTVVDPTTGDSTRYLVTRGDFAPDGQTGWLTGAQVFRRTNAPAAISGLILQTTDGGATWSRQGITGAPNLGLGFPLVNDVQALSTTFAVLSGNDGLVAARRGAAGAPIGPCVFNEPAGGGRARRSGR